MQLGAQVASVAQTWVGRFHRVQASQFLRRFFVFFDKRFQFLLYVEQLGRHGTDACKGFGVLACSFGVHVKHHGRRQGAVVFQDGLQVRGVAIQECPIPRVKVLQHLAMALSFFDARALSSGQAIDARENIAERSKMAVLWSPSLLALAASDMRKLYVCCTRAGSQRALSWSTW